MQSVVSSGTGHRASVIGRPVAGKTGTTNGAKDAWFIGYIPQLVTGVWVGYDQERSLGSGGTGGQAAAPIWGDFMQKAIMSLPAEDFEAPENVSFVLINPHTGNLAKEDTAGAVMECFIKGTEPESYDKSGTLPFFPSP
jgi:penicillin-binding protein 1A